MKNSKKYISIILPIFVLSFITIGLISAPKIVVALMAQEPDTGGTNYLWVNSGTGENTGSNITEEGGGGISTTNGVSDSITVNVLISDDSDPDLDTDPVCSKTTYYECEKGEVTLKKEESNKYLWNCTSGSETLGCAKEKPVCSTTTVNGCVKGYSSNYNKSTGEWLCNGSNGNPTISCKIVTEGGKSDKECDYPEANVYVGPVTAYDCKNGQAENQLLNESTNKYEWTCPGQNGEEDSFCQSEYYPSAVCGGDGDCLSGYKSDEVFVEGELVSWKCNGSNGDVPKTIEYEYVYRMGELVKIKYAYHNRSTTCYPDDDGGGDDNGEDIIIDGQCADKLGECLSGEKTSVTTDEKGNSYWQCLGSEKGKTDYCFIEGPDEPPVKPPITPPKDPINGICGSSNGLFFKQEPTSSLCQQGEVSGGVLEKENNSWSWICAGLYGGENAKCNTMSVSLTPKLSGCYVGQDQSSCQIEEPFNWLVSGIYNLLSLVTNKSEIALEGGSGQKNLEIGYPFSDIKLKVDGGEVASSRAWAVCGNGLYWDSESGTCLKPEVCPGEPDYQELKTPYWTYEYGECIIPEGENKGELTVVGTCQNYDKGPCQKADGTDHTNKTKEITYPCFVNPPQDIKLTVKLWATRIETDVDVTGSNPVTETKFNIHWEATTNPSGKVRRCDNIKAHSRSIPNIETDGEATGEREAYHPGASQDTEYSITCYDNNGHPETAKTTVYFGEIDSNVAEV